MNKNIITGILGTVLLLFASEKMSAQNSLLQLLPKDSVRMETISLGYMTLNANQIIGAVTVLNAEDIQKFDNRNTIYDALQSRVPGFVSETRAGSLVAEPNIRGSKINFIIDGMKGDPKLVQLQEVEKIVVLKDAMSRMAFGDKSLEMLVVITTKRGFTSGKDKISANFEYGLDIPKSYPKYLNSFDYATLYNEGQLNDNPAAVARYTSAQLDGYKSADRVRYPDLDFFNSTFLKDYKSSGRLFVDYRGGGKNTKYYMNLSGNINNSLLKLGEGDNESTQKYALRANIDTRISSFCSYSIDVYSSYLFNHLAGEPDVAASNFYNHAATVRPNEYPMLIPVDMLVGTTSENLMRTAKVLDNNILGGTNLYQSNIYGELMLRGNSREVERNSRLNTKLDFDLNSLLKGLNFTVGMSFDFFAIQSFKLRNKYAVYMPQYDASNKFTGVTRQTDPDEFSATRSNYIKTNVPTFYRRNNLYGNLSWNQTFNSHSITANLLGYNERYTYTSIPIEDKNVYFSLNTAYAFKGKYLAQFSGTYLGSQVLPQYDMFRFEPSAGAAWVISKEKFLKNFRWLDYLKLRASWGIIKSDHVFKNTQLSSYGLYNAGVSIYNTLGGSYATGGKVGTLSMRSTIINQVGNPDIDLASREEFNVGVDATLFNKTLDATLNIYQQSDKGNPTQVANRTADYIGGLNMYRNYGETRERAMEMSLTYNKQTEDFKFTIGANFLRVFDSKIIQIDEPLYQNPGMQSQTGKSVGAIYGYVFDGFYKDQADIDNTNPLNKSTIRPGDLRYLDLYTDTTGYRILDGSDTKQIGKSRPTVVSAFNINLSYKGFDFFTCLTSSLGGDVFLYDLNPKYYKISGEMKYPAYLVDRWTPQTAETAKFPRMSVSANTNNNQPSTFWLRKNNRLDVTAVQLSYNIPPSIFGNKGFISKCKVYIRGNNLLTLSPIADELNLSIGTEPQYRSFMVGLNFNF